MSFQLIYTSAPTLLDPGLSGYGVVARSKDMPRLLSKKLAKLSLFKDELKLVSGPQFSYNILDCAGATFHVLTCVQSAGADYSGRECHIAHHLVLTKQEVRELKENKARPTPAGLMLGLYTGEFWATCWNLPPKEIEEEAELSIEMLPELHLQSMWKELTGHKYNAKTLITPPYEHDCLIIVQPGTRSLDILHLLAESDWLSASRGWGITFTTTGYSQDTFAQTQRIAVIEESAMASKARRSGRPILKLVHKLLIPRQEQLDTPSSPQIAHNFSSSHSRDWTQLDSTPTPPPQKKAPLVSQPQGHQLAEAPYKYQESTDEQSYLPTKQKKCLSRHARWLIPLLCSITLLIGATIYFIHERDDLISSGSPADTHDHTGRGQQPLPPLYASLYAQSIQDIENIHQQLLELAQQSYKAHKAQEKLLDLQSQIPSVTSHTSPRIGKRLHLLHAIITKLHEAQQSNISYPDLLESLVTYARNMELDLEPLARFYFKQCTQRHSPHQWTRSMSEKDAQRILHLLHENKLYSLFNEPELYSHLHALDRHDPINRHFTYKPSSFEDILSTYAHLNDRELIIINKDDAIPLMLQEILQHTPISIDQGAISVSPLLSDEWRSSLQKGKHSIRIVPTRTAGLKKIQFISKNEPTAPAAMLLQADARFQQFNYQGRPALLNLKLSASPTANQYLFISHFRQALTTMSPSYELPKLTRHDFNIAHDELESIPPDSLQPYAQLRLTSKYRSQFPWKTIQINLKLKQPSHIKLPSYSGYSNEVSIEEPTMRLHQVAPIIRYSLHIDKYSNQPYLDERYHIQLKRNYNFNSILEREFYTLANSCIAQKNLIATGDHSIASLYHLLNSMDEISSLSEFDDLMINYFRLFENRLFAARLNKIFNARPALQLSPLDADSKSSIAKARRDALSETIRDKDTRAFMRESLRNYLAEELYRAYCHISQRASLHHQIHQRHEFELYHLDKQQNKLIWHFRLINDLAAQQPSPSP